MGAVGQVVSAFAFVLAIVQIRHVRADTQRAIRQERAERALQINMAAVTNERLATLRVKVNETLRAGAPIRHPFMRAATERFGITEVEAFMLLSDQMLRWGSFSAPEKSLSTGERAQVDRVARLGFQEPIFQFWYEHMKSALNPDLVHYVESLKAQQPNSTPG